ncbi:dihydrodipicolinate synthase family protein [Mucilaginibacter sp. RS28]|uniref:Dihydrodipicolinate synthase family protein n=1 Tax=Mucilaginibacter straminoryzae TaxID=2932774 RepID=A0A9X1X2H4_9SPHI|nr:dihydrodipicolinate synthase family protein [Mucilaginibacter straminoryzae]MCJ8210022.1 dihydrodipicolinate synthase family protein [Mucilaginibacter straminoryzae]
MIANDQQTNGFIPVMLTPFKEDGQVDYMGLTRLTETYIEAGASGLFANCLSSEMFELSPSERIAVVAHVLKVTNNRVPVVATGTFGGPIAAQAEFVKEMYATGVQAVILITGLLAQEHEADQVFEDNVMQLLSLTGDVPVGFYECPVPYKRLITPAQLGKFARTGRVIYHKDTCLDIELIREKLAAIEGTKCKLYDAYMVHAVESLKAGSAGLSCIQGNYFPELIVWLCNHYDNIEYKEQVNAVQQFLIDNMDLMHHVYPVTAKYCLQKRGVDISIFTRRDVGSFTSLVQHDIDVLMNQYHLLSEQCHIEQVIGV